MHTHADRLQEHKNQLVTNTVLQKYSNSESAFQVVSTRPEAIQMQKLHTIANTGSQVKKLKALQKAANNSTQTKQVTQLQQYPKNSRNLTPKIAVDYTIRKKHNPTTVPVVQRIGSNVAMVEEEDRHFETPSGKTRLRVNPDADAYLEDHFEKGTASKHTDVSLADKFAHAMENVHKKIPYNRQGKIEALNEHRQPVSGGLVRRERGLGYMLHTNSATCWEKAAFFHMVLAELGIPTVLEGGYRKSDGEGHAWLVVKPHPQLFGGKSVVIDPTVGKIGNRAKFEKYYNITVPPKAVATPKVAQKPKDIEKALREFRGLSQLDGIVKKAVVETVELKIERVMNDRRREAERIEFEKLLAGLRKF